MKELLPTKINRKSGDEVFVGHNSKKLLRLRDFWQWSSSDLVSNATRGVLAEFLVASALGLDQGVRKEWDAYDLKTESGVKIEVKSAAYIQSWHQQKLSNIIFNIRSTRAFDYKTNRFSKEKKRQADVYVFCLLHHKDKETINPLDLSQWTFYVVSTDQLERDNSDARSLSLVKLEQLNPKKCDLDGLRQAIEDVLGNSPTAAGQ